MRFIPTSLMYLRLLIGLVILIFSLIHIEHYVVLAIILISVGLLTDIFDGIIARHLKISTEKMRRLDSTIDQAFWCFVAAATYVASPMFFRSHALQLGLLIGVEAGTYIISFVKFRKEVATHAISSKIWTLILFATLLELIITGNSGLLFQVCFYLGILTRIEIIVILLLLRKWTNDVPSVFHAIKLRQGKVIRRHKLFNG